jgi:hypothetical protein
MFRRYLLGLSVLALAACSGGCDAFKPTRYIHAVEANLRAQDATQQASGMLPMGTRCKVLEDEGLLEILVRCGELTGYVNKDDLGPMKPTVQGFLAAAEDPKLYSWDRVTLATRAVALAPADAEARAALRKYFLDDQFHRLQLHKQDEDAKPFERGFVCEEGQGEEDCLTEYVLPGRLFSAQMLERRGGDFVGVGFQAGQLYTVRGTLRRLPPGEGNDISYTVYPRAFGGVDVPRVAEALGLKPAQQPERQPRYTTNDSYYERRLCNQLTVADGATSTVLVDLEKQLPPRPTSSTRAGRGGAEVRPRTGTRAEQAPWPRAGSGAGPRPSGSAPSGGRCR